MEGGTKVGLGLQERKATEGREANEGRTVHERAHEKGAMNVNDELASCPVSWTQGSVRWHRAIKREGTVSHYQKVKNERLH